MRQARRMFLRVAGAMAVAAALGAAQQDTQQQDSTQQRPSVVNVPDRAWNTFGPNGSDATRSNPRAIMKANQDTVKKDVARMAEITQQLQNELENNDSKNVLSLDVLHKSEEIEKLAKEVKDLLRS